MLAIYTRLSKEEESNSIENQIRAGEEFAKSIDQPFTLYNEGEGVSGGAAMKDRPQLSRLLKDVEGDDISIVWCRDSSRLFRDIYHHAMCMKLFKEKGVKVYYGNKLFDPNDTQQKLLEDMLAAFNEFRRTDQGRLTKETLIKGIKLGKAHGQLPYGYSSDNNQMLVINEIEAPIIKQIYDMSLHGLGTQAIAEELNRQGVPTRYNQTEGTLKTRHGRRINRKDIKWAGGTVRAIIVNKIYKGERHWQGEIYPCPKILEPDYWQKVNDNLKNNANTPGRKVDHKYLLKGLVKCGRCGRNYYGKSRVSKRDHYYMCSSKRRGQENCGNRSVNIDFIEGLIWGYFISQDIFLQKLEEYFAILNKDSRLSNIEEQEKPLQVDLDEARKRRSRIIEQVELGNIEGEDVKGRMQALKTEIDAIKTKLKRLEEQRHTVTALDNEQNGIKDEVRQAKELSWNDRQEFLKKYIDRIEVKSSEILRYIYIEVFPAIDNMPSTTYIAPYSLKEVTEYRDNLRIDASGYSHDEGFTEGGYDFNLDEKVIPAETFVKR